MALKSISIEDFSGGKNMFDDQLLLPTNACVSATKNVWAPSKALTKTPGYTLYLTVTSTALAIPWFMFDASISTANTLYHRIVSADGNSYPTLTYPWFGQTDSLTPMVYSTGTCALTGVSATGSGTLWSTHVTANDAFRINATSSAWAKVSSIEDNTHLTLNAALPGNAAAGSAYGIMPVFSQVSPNPLVGSRINMAAAVLNGQMIMTMWNNFMQLYNGTGMNRIQAGPEVAFLTVHKNYVFGFRTSTAQSRLYWSASKDPTSWPANNTQDVDVANGVGTGLFSFGNELIVFKTYSAYRVIGDVFDPSNPTYAILPIQTPKYFLFDSNYTCAVHRGVLTFQSFGRMYIYRPGSGRIEDISQKIFQDFPSSGWYALGQYPTANQAVYATVFHDKYIIKGFLGDGSNSAGILDGNGSWWYILDANSYSATFSTESPFSNGPLVILPASATDTALLISNVDDGVGGAQARIFKWDVVGPSYAANYLTSGSPTATSAINATWRSKEFNIKYGTFKWIVIYLNKVTGLLTVQWSIDQATSISYTLDMSAGRGNMLRAVIPVNQKGSTIQLTLSNNAAGVTFKIYAIEIIYEESPLERLV